MKWATFPDWACIKWARCRDMQSGLRLALASNDRSWPTAAGQGPQVKGRNRCIAAVQHQGLSGCMKLFMGLITSAFNCWNWPAVAKVVHARSYFFIAFDFCCNPMTKLRQRSQTIRISQWPLMAQSPNVTRYSRQVTKSRPAHRTLDRCKTGKVAAMKCCAAILRGVSAPSVANDTTARTGLD